MDTTITNDLIREIIFSGNEDTRQDFVQHFDAEIETFVASLTRAQKRLKEMGPRVPYDKRSA
ncbi:MAG TPA: hypothetical protein VMW42_04555, partial [Desulfatiglandales bacterium]|nr:hypothetical protein [Desulfatiglandales bacterium]